MFYKMITRKRDEWFTSDCVVKELIEYIEKTNQMRDAQVDAIKTYLFLKIACDNKPLFELFKNGVFNTLDLDELEVSSSVRTALQNKPALAALYEYASLKDDSGNQVSEKICKEIKRNPEGIDAREFFKNAFYGVTYTDYLFSLPMGAGKTYLMAAFVYLDLYFAINEPSNPNFAHNFIIFAPSGLKSSVVPSLRTIQNFIPSWVIPEPVASELKRMLIFEVLDENKTAKKSNKTKNPNVQKIAIHQPLTDLMGLVAVTNAEKVILDRVEEKNGQISLFEESDDEKDKVDFYQLKVNYKTVVVQKVEDVDIRDSIKLSVDIAKRTNIIKTAEISDSLQTKADMVEKIILDDNGKLTLDKKNQQMYDLAVQTGNDAIIDFFKKQMTSHPMKDKSFHYLPYKTDSFFEQKFLDEVLTENAIKDNELEVYYNGDRVLTEFKIKCYQQVGKKCNYIGMYTPDFLIIKRKDGKIYKALIVETKGEIYANDPTFKQKRNFMESAFIKQNNDKFGYNRFDYLYLEDTLGEKDRIVLTLETIKKFFTEE